MSFKNHFQKVLKESLSPYDLVGMPFKKHFRFYNYVNSMMSWLSLEKGRKDLNFKLQRNSWIAYNLYEMLRI